jgi:hypothetical protein
MIAHAFSVPILPMPEGDTQSERIPVIGRIKTSHQWADLIQPFPIAFFFATRPCTLSVEGLVARKNATHSARVAISNSPFSGWF